MQVYLRAPIMGKAIPNHESSPQVLSGLLPGGWYKALYLLSSFWFFLSALTWSDDPKK